MGKPLIYIDCFLKLPPQSSGKHLNIKEISQLTCQAFGRQFVRGSTLRRTLGILLEEESGYPLRRVGSGGRMTFTHLGEQWLDAWMNENALVCWLEHPAPWQVERDVFASLSLPLNIQDNRSQPFASRLSGLRKAAIAHARETPIAREDR